MKFVASIAIVSAFVASAVADFHIQNCAHSYGTGTSGSGQAQGGYDWPAIATPSNQWNCNGFRSSPIADGTDGINDKEKSVFSVSNLCGMAKLNFYPSGDTLKVYENNGNGQVIGTCYKGDHSSKACAGAFDLLTCTNDWVCYSYVCN